MDVYDVGPEPTDDGPQAPCSKKVGDRIRPTRYEKVGTTGIIALGDLAGVALSHSAKRQDFVSVFDQSASQIFQKDTVAVMQRNDLEQTHE